VIFINDMPQLTNHFCKLFADDSKLIGVIKNSQDKCILQQDIDILVDWSRKWQMCFNISKCKVLEIKSNRLSNLLCEQNELSMEDASGSRLELAKTNSEKDLGVVLNNKLKWNDHIDQSILKANAALGMLKRTFKFWNCKIFKQLYTAMVRPHLEYCSAVWNPHLKKDISKLERVQRRATKLVPYIRDLPYEERLKKLDILSLEERRVRGDLIQFFKFYKGFNRVNWFHTMVPLHSLSAEGPAGATRGGEHRLVKQVTKLDHRANFLSNRVVNEWNKLPTEVVSSSTVNQFKNKLDKFKGH
jgi:ribonucleases P/MRP protein subunit RPP40